jgi:cytochrome P450
VRSRNPNSDKPESAPDASGCTLAGLTCGATGGRGTAARHIAIRLGLEETSPMTTIEASPAVAPRAPGRLPLLGHLVQLGRRPIDFMQETRQVGPVVEIGFGPRPGFVVNDPDLIRKVFVGDAGVYDKGVFWDKVRLLVGDGLANVDNGELHLQLRRLIQPAFHRTRIAQYTQVMSQCILDKAQSWKPGEVVTIPAEMNDLAVELVARSLFVSDLGEDAYEAFKRRFPAVQDGIMKRTLMPIPGVGKLPTPGNIRFNQGIREMQESIDRAITAYRASGVDHGDLMSTLISSYDEETGQSMDDELIRAQVITFALAGRDTVSNTLNWAVYLLGGRPDVADRVAAEVEKTVGDGAIIGFEDIKQLDYTSRVVMEVLRLYPFWLLLRRAKADTVLGGVQIPAKSNILISPLAMHRDPALYSDPLVLDPDRWLPDRAQEIPRNAYFPFGAGNRQCIGDRFASTAVTLAVATFTRLWHLEPIPGHTPKEVARIAVNPSSLPMRMRPRSVV